jgi:hypothetical protein
MSRKRDCYDGHRKVVTHIPTCMSAKGVAGSADVVEARHQECVEPQPIGN